MKRAPLGLAMAACGAVILVMALPVGLTLIGPTAGVIALAVVGGAAVLVGGVFAHDRARTSRGMLGHALRVGAVVVATVLVSAFASRFDLHLDVTSARVNTLTEQSMQVATAVAAPIVIQAFMEVSDRAFIELEPLVARYRAVNPRIALQRTSPLEDPQGARRARIDEGGARVVVRMLDPTAAPREIPVRFEPGAADHEELLTNALRRLQGARLSRLYFLAGHGEADLRDDGPRGLSGLREALAGQGVEAVPLPLAVVGAVPADAVAIAIADARQPIPDGEQTQLRSFLDNGGAVWLLAEPESAVPSLVLANLGVVANSDVILDPSPFSLMLGGPEAVTGVGYVAHAITRPLGTGLTHFLRARSLTVLPVASVGEAVPLVQSGAEAWGERNLTAGVTPKLDDGDVEGPVAVGAVWQASSIAGAARAAVFGDATFVQNRGLPLGANRDLGLNTALWLLEDDGHIVVRPNRRGGNLVFLTPTEREHLALLLLLVAPCVFACVGVGVFFRRRSR